MSKSTRNKKKKKEETPENSTLYKIIQKLGHGTFGSAAIYYPEDNIFSDTDFMIMMDHIDFINDEFLHYCTQKINNGEEATLFVVEVKNSAFSNVRTGKLYAWSINNANFTPLSAKETEKINIFAELNSSEENEIPRMQIEDAWHISEK